MAQADMFMLVSQIFVAYVAGIFILAGFAISLIGLFILYAELFPRKGDKVVKATIVGVRANAEGLEEGSHHINYPVSEYVGEDGQLKRVESMEGSSSLTDKMPGKHVQIRLHADKPGWATPIGKTGRVIGLVLCCFGVLFLVVS